MLCAWLLSCICLLHERSWLQLSLLLRMLMIGNGRLFRQSLAQCKHALDLDYLFVRHRKCVYSANVVQLGLRLLCCCARMRRSSATVYVLGYLFFFLNIPMDTVFGKKTAEHPFTPIFSSGLFWFSCSSRLKEYRIQTPLVNISSFHISF